jgi:ferredoxin
MMQIEINEKKCTSPWECRKCLAACPETVLMAYPLVGRQPGKAPEDWRIRPVFLTLCTGCKICSEICPQNAITVSIAE